MRVLALAVVAIPTLIPAPAAAQPLPGEATVVLVHGAWGGGWDWRPVERELRARGHEVFRATLTGHGERVHLASPDVGLATHVADVANLIAWERLEEVVLVGHSYGGMIITGVAEAVPERIGRLVYLDAMLPFDGECATGIMNGLDEDCGHAEAVEGQVDGLLPPRWVPPDAPVPHDVPHSVLTFVDRIDLAGAPGNGLPASYIITRETPGQPDGFDAFAARARELGWPVLEMIADHNPQRTKIAELVDLILTVR